jgi:valyl-tRNA synthetase
MLVHGDWPSYGADLIDAEADREMNWVIGLIEEIRSSRTQMGVPVGLKLPMVLAEADEAARAALANNEALILKLARIDSITETAIPKGAISIPAPGALFGLPLEGVIDIGAEKARLEKALGKIEKEIGGLKGRLSNPQFIAKASDEVVEEARDNLAAREEEAAKVAAAVKRLAELG